MSSISHISAVDCLHTKLALHASTIDYRLSTFEICFWNWNKRFHQFQKIHLFWICVTKLMVNEYRNCQVSKYSIKKRATYLVEIQNEFVKLLLLKFRITPIK